MAQRRMTLSFRGIGDAMRDPGVRAQLSNEANRIASAARRINTAEDIDARVEVSNGTDSTRRPYARVSSTAVAEEFGNSKTARRRVLGRAAEQGS